MNFFVLVWIGWNIWFACVENKVEKYICKFLQLTVSYPRTLFKSNFTITLIVSLHCSISPYFSLLSSPAFALFCSIWRVHHHPSSSLPPHHPPLSSPVLRPRRRLLRRRGPMECCPCSWDTTGDQLMSVRWCTSLKLSKVIPSSGISSSSSCYSSSYDERSSSFSSDSSFGLTFFPSFIL